MATQLTRAPLVRQALASGALPSLFRVVYGHPALFLGSSVDAIYAALHDTCGLRSYHFSITSLAAPMLTVIRYFSDTTRLQATRQRRTAGTCIVVPKGPF